MSCLVCASSDERVHKPHQPLAKFDKTAAERHALKPPHEHFANAKAPSPRATHFMSADAGACNKAMADAGRVDTPIDGGRVVKTILPDARVRFAKQRDEDGVEFASLGDDAAMQHLQSMRQLVLCEPQNAAGYLVAKTLGSEGVEFRAERVFAGTLMLNAVLDVLAEHHVLQFNLATVDAKNVHLYRVGEGAANVGPCARARVASVLPKSTTDALRVFEEHVRPHFRDPRLSIAINRCFMWLKRATAGSRADPTPDGAARDEA